MSFSPVTNPYYAVPLEPTDGAGIRAALERDGLCVIANVLTEEEQKSYEDNFWAAIQKRKPEIERYDASTWTDENTNWWGTLGGGLYKHYGMAQEAHGWVVRKSEAVKRIFEEGVFAKDGKRVECTASLDGCAAQFVPSKRSLRLHVDVVPGVEGDDWGAIQASYSLYPVQVNEDRTKGSGGFVAVVGSHRVYEEWWAEEKLRNSFKQPTEHSLNYIRADSPYQQKVQLVIQPANSMVLWRSDLLHMNYGGDFTAQELALPGQSARLPRLTQFVTFHPKSYRTEAVRLRKALSVVDGVSNNHWASLSNREDVVMAGLPDDAPQVQAVLPFAHLKKEGATPEEVFASLPADIQALL